MYPMSAAITQTATAGPSPAPKARQISRLTPRSAANPTNFREVTRSTVQPGGFPATSSLCRIRSPWSAGVSLAQVDEAVEKGGQDSVVEGGLELLLERLRVQW